MNYFKGFNSGQGADRKLQFSRNLDKGKKDFCKYFQLFVIFMNQIYVLCAGNWHC